MYIANQFFANA